ncbi:hypothetical protein [Sphingomonas aquatilis]
MSRSLPPYAARIDEPIPAPSCHPFAGPDMREAIPIETMLAQLAHVADDDAAFVEQFRAYIRSIGCILLAHFDRDGELHINVSTPADPQSRHRRRWTHFLFDRLDAVDSRRALLLRQLIAERSCWDERPARPRDTTLAIRDFLKAGGRILLSPYGRLEEGGCDAAMSLVDPRADACAAAAFRYIEVRRRFRADRQIRRAVRLIGRAENGWRVLEARS